MRGLWLRAQHHTTPKFPDLAVGRVLRARLQCSAVERWKSHAFGMGWGIGTSPQNGAAEQPAVGGKRFDRARRCAYTDGMEINLSPELQAKLDRIASQQGRNSESLVHEAVERLVSYDEWFIRQVEKGLAQVDRGEVLEHEEVAARMERLITQKQRRV